MRTLTARLTPLPFVRSGGWRLVERNFIAYRRHWLVFVSGFFEPVFYLLSIGVGVAGLVGEFTLSDGTTVGYTTFVAPAMLAASAMNGAVFDTTYNIFFKMKYAKLYDAMLATPLRPWDVATGEVGWGLLRGGLLYSAMFVVVMVVMGLVESWWTLLALPAAMLVGYAFAGAGMAATTWMRSWQDFEFIQLTIMPMFLFSATFFPLAAYPGPLQAVITVTPLYQGVVLIRGLTTGVVGWDLLIAVAYLAAMGTIGMYVASRRLARLLLK